MLVHVPRAPLANSSVLHHISKIVLYVLLLRVRTRQVQYAEVDRGEARMLD